MGDQLHTVRTSEECYRYLAGIMISHSLLLLMKGVFLKPTFYFAMVIKFMPTRRILSKLRYALVGDFAANAEYLSYDKLFDNYGIQTHTLTNGKHKLRADHLEKFKRSDETWIKKMAANETTTIREEILSLKAKKFKKLKLTNDEVNTQLFSNKMPTLNELMNVGYIDGIATGLDVMAQEFPEYKSKVRVLGNFGLNDMFAEASISVAGP